jgi:aryl-alcohol dehydrogenase-like predicted oxidoreductase
MSSRIALGTVQFGVNYGVANQTGKVNKNDVVAILAQARLAGIETLDTAIAYGDSESVIGSIGVNGRSVVTKLPSLPEDCVDVQAWVNGQIEASLSRLGIDKVYGLLLHNTHQLLGVNGSKLAAALKAIRKNGLAQKIGLSIYSPDELDACYGVLQPDLVQAPLNLVDRRLISSGWLRRLSNSGVEIHTRSSFLQGLLLMSPTEIPAKFRSWSWSWIWERWQIWLSMHPEQALSACLSYPLSYKEVSKVIIGVDNPSQFTEIVKVEGSLIPIKELPDLMCDDNFLINPSMWQKL